MDIFGGTITFSGFCLHFEKKIPLFLFQTKQCLTWKNIENVKIIKLTDTKIKQVPYEFQDLKILTNFWNI